MKPLNFFLRSMAVITILVLAVIYPFSSAMAFTAGPSNPAAGDNVTGTGTEVWLNPGEVITPGTPYAMVTLYQGHRFSNYLQASQYGFAIPTDSSIIGIEVTINRTSSSHNPNIVDTIVSLVKGGVIMGDNKAVLAAPWPTTFTLATYGGPTDLWGLSWTPAEINAGDFGVALAVNRDSNGNNTRNAAVDSMQVTVYYGYNTTTAVHCGDGSPIMYGDSVVCVATVTRLQGDQTPTGSVGWSSDGSGTFDPNPCILAGADGIATCSATYTPAAVGSGSHLLTATYSGDELYGGSSASQPQAVLTRPITVTADPQTKVYGQADPPLTYQLTDGSLVFTDTFTGSLARATGENVGEYAILQGSLTLPASYDLTFTGNTFTITKADPTCVVTPYNVAYDGSVHLATGSCTGVLGENLPGLDLSLTAHSEVGSYTDPWTFTDQTGNYNGASGSVNDIIGKANANCVITPYDVTFDGDPHTATGACTGLQGEPLSGLDLTATTHTNAGDYTDPWTFTDPNGDYADQAGEINNLIGMADASCNVTPYNLTYNGLPHTAEGTCSGINGEPLAGLDLSGTSHTNAGNYPVDPWSFIDPIGNYHNDNGTVHDVIGQANPACNINPYHVVYDGFAHSASGMCTGVLGEPLDGLDLSNTNHLLAGSYTDPWTFMDQTGNYHDTSGTVGDVIDQADPACEIIPYDVTYDAQAHLATGFCTGVNGEPLSGLDLDGTSHTNVGNYTDSWTFTDMTGNYHDTSGTVDDSINRADPTCDITPYDVTYDGQAHNATGLCHGVIGEPLNGLDLGATVHTNAGSYTDSWFFTSESDNYNDASGTIIDLIAKAEATCQVTGYNVEYDQEFHTAIGGCTGVLGEQLVGLNLSGTTHINVGVYPSDPWIFVDGSGNYSNAQGTVSDEISKRPITVMADPKLKVFGHPDPELTYQITSGSLLIFDSFTGHLIREAGEDIGTYQILQGTLALPNYYEITYVGATFTIYGGRILLPIINK